MQSYPQITPVLRARGQWRVRKPFSIVEASEYTCIAIRSFKDMYNDGIDPYEQIYRPHGLIDGFTNNDGVFRFREEHLRGINIISIVDNLGNVKHIPDNYILSYPNSTAIRYEHVILSCSLGPLPEGLDLSMAKQAVEDAVGSYFGVKAEVLTHAAETTIAPTYEEHLALEQARMAAVNVTETSQVQIEELKAKLELANNTVNTLSQILIDNNLMPTEGRP